MIRIRESQKDIFAKIAKYHWKKLNINSLDQKMPDDGAFIDMNEIKDVKVQLLAAYTRLADSLYICSTRESEEEFALHLTMNLPNDEKIH